VAGWRVVELEFWSVRERMAECYLCGCQLLLFWFPNVNVEEATCG